MMEDEELPESFADMETLDAECVWADRIPVGEVSFLAAFGGTGKGILSIGLAALITNGKPLPGEKDAFEPSPVIWASAEDDSMIVTGPRLKAAGADREMVFDLSEIDGAAFSLDEHMPQLEKAVRLTGARLVILDPLSGLTSVSLFSPKAVRALLRPLRDMARRTGTAVLVLHHVNKDGKVSGSQTVTDVARVVLKVTADENAPEVRVIEVAKTNIGAKPSAIRYVIRSAEGSDVPYAVFLSDEDDAQAQPEKLTGQDKIALVLADAGPGGLAAQSISGLTLLEYPTVRVLLRRMVVNGRAVELKTPGSKWAMYAAGVTSAGQGCNTPQGVTPGAATA